MRALPLFSRLFLGLGMVVGAANVFACAAILSLPDPSLDDGIAVPGDESQQPNVDGDVTKVDGSTTDAPITDGAGKDAIAPACDLTKPFGNIARINELNGPQNDVSTSLTESELQIFWSTYPVGGGAYTLYRATRTTTSAKWGTPQQIFASTAMAFAPCISLDGSNIYFTKLTGGAQGDIYSSPTSKNFQTGTETMEPTLVPSGMGGAPICGSLVKDGSMYWAAAELTQGGKWNPYHSTRNAGGFNPSVTIASIGAPTSAPVVTRDELTVYIGGPPAPKQSIVVAKRGKTTDSFGTPTQVASLASTGFDVPGWISTDQCRLYFSSTRDTEDGGNGDFEIYIATRPK